MLRPRSITITNKISFLCQYFWKYLQRKKVCDFPQFLSDIVKPHWAEFLDFYRQITWDQRSYIISFDVDQGKYLSSDGYVWNTNLNCAECIPPQEMFDGSIFLFFGCIREKLPIRAQGFYSHTPISKMKLQPHF